MEKHHPKGGHKKDKGADPHPQPKNGEENKKNKTPTKPGKFCTTTNGDDSTKSSNFDSEVPLEPASFIITVVTPYSEFIQIPVMLMESVQEIRQFLLEAPETCYVTSYHLEFNGVPVNDFCELSELSGLKEGSQFSIVEDEYSETGARLHTRRTRELLWATFGSNRKDSPSLFTDYSKQTPNMEIFKEIPKWKEHVTISEYFPESCVPPRAVKKLCYSDWNPPPGNRKLQGDLFYLEVLTLEGNTVTITASVKGFFVNSTKPGGSFNPSPADSQAHSLVALLRKISAKFDQVFASLLKTNLETHPYELLPVPLPVKPWLANPEQHSCDPNRAEDALIFMSEVDFNIQGQTRDWNEELQVCREQPRETIQDRIVRDRASFKIHSEFVAAATSGAVEVISKNVPPINPADEPKAHMYIYNNIFYSHALDTRDFYKDVGGDTTAYKQAANDLQGVLAYNRTDVKGLYTLGTVIVNYRGYRLVAQTIIPGLFSSLLQEDASVNIAYGSLEGNDLKCNEEFHKLMLQAAEKLYIKSHILIGKDGSSAELASHADIKGIVGSDHRRYILDLVRTTPRDANYPKSTDLGAILRPELLERYIVGTHDNDRRGKIEAFQKAEESKKPSQKLCEEEFLEEIQKIFNEKMSANLACNTDVLTPAHLGGSEEEIEEDEATVKMLATYLKEKVIPGLVDDIVAHRVNPVDSQTLTNLLHSRGINLRYFGTITKLIQQQGKTSSFTLIVLYREMISRVFKHIFSEIMRQTKVYDLSLVVTNVLNAFFGRVTSGEKGSRSGIVPNLPTPSLPTTELTHNELWANIRNRVTSKYDFSLPELIPATLFTFPTLRAICQRVGIQLVVRNYDLSAEKPFQFGDVVQLFPVVKHSEPFSVDAKDLVEASKLYMAQARLDIAYELLSEALAVLQQVYGPMHKDAAQCHSNLARLLHDSDLLAAIQHLQKAVVINERVHGLDHYETAYAYNHLALYSHQQDPSKIPLNFAQRAYYINLLLADLDNMDNIDTYTNIGTILQDLEAKEESRLFLEKALNLSTSLFGTYNVQTARLCHVVAIAYTSAGEYKEALKYETKNYEICFKLFGEKDPRTMESNIWLGQLTRNAVQRARAQLQSNLPHKQKHDTSSAFSAATNPLASLPIEDVLKYIQQPTRTRDVFVGAVMSSTRVGHMTGGTPQQRLRGKRPVLAPTTNNPTLTTIPPKPTPTATAVPSPATTTVPATATPAGKPAPDGAPTAPASVTPDMPVVPHSAATTTTTLDVKESPVPVTEVKSSVDTVHHEDTTKFVTNSVNGNVGEEKKRKRRKKKKGKGNSGIAGKNIEVR